MAQDQVLTTATIHLNELADRMEKAAEPLSDDQVAATHPSGEWGVGEVAQHLLMSHQRYLDPVDKAVQKGEKGKHEGAIELTMLGKLMVAANKPEASTPAPGFLHPKSNGHYGKQTVSEAAAMFRRMASQAEAMREVEITKTKIRVPVVPVLKMSLADYVELVSQHGERHVRQMEERAPDMVSVTRSA